MQRAVRRSRGAAALLLLLAAVTSCAAPSGDSGPRTAAETDTAFGHVHGVALNPGDGLVYAATHTGVVRLDGDGPRRVGPVQDTMGFTVAGPDLFLASGHPGPQESGPAHLGLIVSTDRAQTWTTRSLAGEADLHALSAAGEVVVAWDALSGSVLRSEDGGSTWSPGATLALADLAVDPADPARVVATSADGLLVSTDGGTTFGPFDPQPPQPLALVDTLPDVLRDGGAPVAGPAGGQGATATTPAGDPRDAGAEEPAPTTGPQGSRRLAGVAPDGAVLVGGPDGWRVVGDLGAPPEAFSAAPDSTLLAATAAGVLASADGGRTWRVLGAPAEAVPTDGDPRDG